LHKRNTRETTKGEPMGISDRLKGLRRKAEDTAGEHKDQIKAAVEKAEVTADQRTEGKYHDQIAKAGAKVEEYVDNLKPGSGDAGAAPAPDEPPAAPPHSGGDAA
jgi:DNA-binding protein H-NS